MTGMTVNDVTCANRYGFFDTYKYTHIHSYIHLHVSMHFCAKWQVAKREQLTLMRRSSKTDGRSRRARKRERESEKLVDLFILCTLGLCWLASELYYGDNRQTIDLFVFNVGMQVFFSRKGQPMRQSGNTLCQYLRKYYYTLSEIFRKLNKFFFQSFVETFLLIFFFNFKASW